MIRRSQVGTHPLNYTLDRSADRSEDRNIEVIVSFCKFLTNQYMISFLYQQGSGNAALDCQRNIDFLKIFMIIDRDDFFMDAHVFMTGDLIAHWS